MTVNEMKVIVACIAGALVGVLAPGPLAAVLAGIIDSTVYTATWHTQTIAGWVAPTAIANTLGALGAALGPPALVLMLCEAARSTRTARTAATTVLAAAAITSFAAPSTAALPFALLALLASAALATMPTRLLLPPWTFLTALSAGAWAHRLILDHALLSNAGEHVSALVGGPPAWWTFAACLPMAALMLATFCVLLRRPRT